MSIAKGIVHSYDVATGLATVEIVGSHPYFVTVPTASHLMAGMVDGRRCAVLFFDDHNPRDGVVLALYDVVADVVNAVQLQAVGVASAAPANLNVLQYLSGTGLWTPAALPAAGAVVTLLTTPLTSTSWDGDAKTSANNGVIDLSAVFGVPAGVKGVLVQLSAKAATVNFAFRVGPNSTYTDAVLGRTQVVNQYNDVAGICPCDANGDLTFTTGGSLTGTVLVIWGYVQY